MCLAIPAKVQSVAGFEAEAEIGEVRRTISVMLTPDVQMGDYVYIHAGYAISVVAEAETYPPDELFYTSGEQAVPL